MHRYDTDYSLAELVQDPLIGLMMKSDGVDPRSIELLFEQIVRQRRADPSGRRRQEARLGEMCCSSM